MKKILAVICMIALAVQSCTYTPKGIEIEVALDPSLFPPVEDYLGDSRGETPGGRTIYQMDFMVSGKVIHYNVTYKEILAWRDYMRWYRDQQRDKERRELDSILYRINGL